MTTIFQPPTRSSTAKSSGANPSPANRTATLGVIHGRNLVHGDVRCLNIFVSEDGNVKFIDFDHCGVDGEDVYPAYLREWDHTQQRDAKEGDVLRKYYDDWMLEHIFDGSP